MHDAFTMQVRQGVEELLRNHSSFLLTQFTEVTARVRFERAVTVMQLIRHLPLPFQELALHVFEQLAALDVFRDDEVVGVISKQLVDIDDVRVFDVAQNFNFVL